MQKEVGVYNGIFLPTRCIFYMQEEGCQIFLRQNEDATLNEIA